MGLKHKILSRHLCTVCPVITLDFEMAIWTWRSLYRVPKMLFWWSLNASFLCPVPWGEFKPLIWPLKEFKVKINFQPCFAQQKAHGAARNRSSSHGNLGATPWKSLEIKERPSYIKSTVGKGQLSKPSCKDNFWLGQTQSLQGGIPVFMIIYLLYAQNPLRKDNWNEKSWFVC